MFYIFLSQICLFWICATIVLLVIIEKLDLFNYREDKIQRLIKEHFFISKKVKER